MDGVQRASFGFDEDITAVELYQTLDFRLNTQYEFAKGSSDDLPADVFDAFCKMMQEIVKGINDVADNDVTDGVADDAAADG